MYLDNPEFKIKEMYSLIKIVSLWICPAAKSCGAFFLFLTNPKAQFNIPKTSFLLIK